MQFTRPIPVQQFADRYNLKVIGNQDLMITGINEIHKVRPGDITFVDAQKYYHKSVYSAASAIIIDQLTDFPEGKALLLTEKPFEVYDQIARESYPFQPITSLEEKGYTIGKNTIIEPQVVIGHRVVIGDDCYIQAGSYIGNDTVIGDRSIIQAGALIGTDAFYFKKENGRYTKWHSCGRVIIENDVVVGAGCTVNRGVSGETIIGEGSKLDSQVHVGHGVVIGKHCLIAAQVGIAGKTIIGDGTVIYGQVGIAQNLHIGEGAVILAKSGVSKNLDGGKVYFGYPAAEAREKYKELAALRMMLEQEMYTKVY
jgi:UDP-3-O-[3-hydroxymyristoyl] glucosamine N-acyltransferase